MPAGLARIAEGDVKQLSVEHPTGEFTVELRLHDGELAGCGLMRTARLLFDGNVCVPDTLY
ncbi:4-oxalomesaconate tautomerase [compost metagenome]